MISGEVSLYVVVEPQVLVMYVDTQEYHIQVRGTDSVNTLIMLDSPENLCMMELNSIVTSNFKLRRKMLK
jgi:hypothetical protein